MVDRVKPLKIESTDTGGEETDLFPTSVNKNEDYIDCRGITIQNDSSNDEVVKMSRDLSDNMTFVDGLCSKNLNELITTNLHKTLRQLIHFIDEGPAEGFVSNAYKEITGNPFPTSIIWWESSSKLKKIISQDISWTGPNPTTVVWKIYATDGSTVLTTITDSINYSGPFEINRTRTIVES